MNDSKAYNVSQDCSFYAISEPAFYGLIKKEQKKGPLKKHDI